MWIIQSIHPGPVHINDVGIMLTHGQTRDLDLLGRENAERSNDVKVAHKMRWIKTVTKDAPEAPKMDHAVVQQLTQASQQSVAAATQMQDVAAAQQGLIERLQAQLAEQIAINRSMHEQMAHQATQTQQVLDNTTKMLDQVKDFAEKHPVEIRSLKETLQNIQVERKDVQQQIAALPASGMSEAEIKAQERILKMKEQKLQKNAESIGKSIAESAGDIQSELDAMDELGI
jgi:chromosome segregation ATPase